MSSQAALMAAIRAAASASGGQVRVVFARQPAVGRLDDLVLGFRVDLEDLVGVDRRQASSGLMPMLRERRGQRLRLVGAEAAEQVAHDIAERGGHRQRQDRPEQPGQRAADDDREHDHGRMQLDRVALDLGHEEVVLDLLDQGVQDERGDHHARAGGGGQEHRRDGRDDRADDRDQLEDAGDDRQQEGVPAEDRVDQLG